MMRLRKINKAFLFLLLMIMALILLALILINQPFAHRFITVRVNHILENADVPITIASIEKILPGSVDIKGVHLHGNTGDTIVYAENILATIAPLALFHKKVIIPSAFLSNSSVRLFREHEDLEINIAEAFSNTGSKKGETEKDGEKSWEVSVGSIDISRLKFRMADSVAGIYIDQEVGSLRIKTNEMSFIDKTILARTIDLENARGRIRIDTKPEAEETGEALDWNFGLAELSLKDINLILDNPVQGSMVSLSLEDCNVKSRNSDLKNKTFDLRKVSLSGARISLQIDEKTEKSNKNSPEKSVPFPWDITCDNLDLENVLIGFDGLAFGINDLTLSMSDILLNSQTSGAALDRLSFDLSNGFSVQRTTGKLDSRGGTTSLNLLVETENSLLHLDGSSDCSLFDLIENQEKAGRINASLNNTRISLDDLVYFKPELLNEPFINTLAASPISIEANISLSDSVSSLSGIRVIQSPNISITAEGNIHHIFEPAKSKGTLQFGISDINPLWLTELLKEIGFRKNIPDFLYLTMEGNLSDSFMSPDFTLEIKSDLGNIDLSGSFDSDTDSFTLVSSFDRVRLDRILDTHELGSYTGSGEIIGTGIGHKSITADAVLSVDSLRFKGYDYTGGTIVCHIRPSIYDFKILVDDPALMLDLSTGVQTIDSVLSINTSGAFMVKANKLNLLKDTVDIEGSLAGDLWKGINSFDADLTITDLVVTTPQKRIDAGLLNTSFRSDTILTILSSQSGFYNLDIQTEKPLHDLHTIIPDFKSYIGSFPDSLAMNPEIRSAHLPGLKAKLNINYHEAFDVILKGFQFEDINLELINILSEEKLQLKILGRDIKYEMLELGTLNTLITDSAGIISLDLATDRSTMFSHPVNRLLLSSRSFNGKGLTKLSIIDGMNKMVYDLEISSEADSNIIYFKVPSKQLIMNGALWQMDSEELMSFNFAGEGLYPSLMMHTDNSSIQLTTESNKAYTLLSCDLRNVQVTSLLPEKIIQGNPEGKITGTVSYNSFADSSREIISDLVFSDLRWSDLDFSNLLLKGQYRSEKPGDWSLEAYSRLDSAEIVLKGEMRDGGSRDLNAELQKFPINTAQPFVKKHLSDLDGIVSGNLKISSNEETKNINGEIIITGGNLRINTLNSAYRIPGEKIGFAGGKILLNNFTVLDSLNNKLFVNGSIDFSNPKDIITDLEISSSDLQVMNRNKKDNSTFYGKIFIDSRLSVNGPLTDPDLKGEISLTSGTEIFYSMKEDLSLSESEKVISFVSNIPTDDNKNLSLSQEQAKVNNSTVKTLVEIDPKTRINFNLSQKMYMIDLMIQGGGALNYSQRKNNQMNLSGKYEIGKGMADVKMIGWPNKQFTIAPGGFIWWDGNIEDPTLKFEALNSVQATYENPVDGKIRNVDFNVILKLSDRLSDLKMIFTINTPDQYLMSIINTLSPEEQMRQAITILLFERIDLPGISTSSDYVTQQVNQILASQLNQLTKTTIKGVDISFGIDTYTSTSSTGGEQTNTSLSYDVKKALLNDRGTIQISGRVNDYSNQQGNTNLSLNNVSFEYQLDSAASKFVKVYNEHTYEDVFEGEVIKTGLGFIYRKSYPTLGDLWRRSGKKKKSNRTEK